MRTRAPGVLAALCASGCFVAPILSPAPMSVRSHAGVAASPSGPGWTGTLEVEVVPTQMLSCSRPVDLGAGARVTWLPDRAFDAPRVGPEFHLGAFLYRAGNHRVELRLAAGLLALDEQRPLALVGASLTWEVAVHAEPHTGAAAFPGDDGNAAEFSTLGHWSAGDLSAGFTAAVEHYEDFDRTTYTTFTLGVELRFPAVVGLLLHGLSNDAGLDVHIHDCDPARARRWWDMRRAAERARRWSESLDERDGDDDGVPDSVDRCSAEVETINGIRDADGCPDRGGRTLWTAPEGDRASTLRGRIRFTANGAIAADSDDAADQLASHLRACLRSRWMVVIADDGRVRIVTLRRYLVERGIPPDCFDVDGSATLSGDTVEVRREARSSGRPGP